MVYSLPQFTLPISPLRGYGKMGCQVWKIGKRVRPMLSSGVVVLITQGVQYLACTWAVVVLITHSVQYLPATLHGAPGSYSRDKAAGASPTWPPAATDRWTTHRSGHGLKNTCTLNQEHPFE